MLFLPALQNHSIDSIGSYIDPKYSALLPMRCFVQVITWGNSQAHVQGECGGAVTTPKKEIWKNLRKKRAALHKIMALYKEKKIGKLN